MPAVCDLVQVEQRPEIVRFARAIERSRGIGEAGNADQA